MTRPVRKAIRLHTHEAREHRKSDDQAAIGRQERRADHLRPANLTDRALLVHRLSSLEAKPCPAVRPSVHAGRPDVPDNTGRERGKWGGDQQAVSGRFTPEDPTVADEKRRIRCWVRVGGRRAALPCRPGLGGKLPQDALRP